MDKVKLWQLIVLILLSSFFAEININIASIYETIEDIREINNQGQSSITALGNQSLHSSQWYYVDEQGEEKFALSYCWIFKI